MKINIWWQFCTHFCLINDFSMNNKVFCKQLYNINNDIIIRAVYIFFVNTLAMSLNLKLFVRTRSAGINI